MRSSSSSRLAHARRSLCAAFLVATGLLAGCSKPAAPSAVVPPKLVAVVTTEAKNLPATSQHVGRVAAYANVEIRSRVQGIIKRNAFTPGTDVAKDQLLFEIEDDYYRAAVAEAQAQLSRAEAEKIRAADYERRLAALVASDAISRQDYENAATLSKQAVASELAARAALARANLDLQNTRVVATEAGRIGRAQVSEGSLVGREGPTHLATIEKIDPVFVLFTIADNEGQAIRKAIAAGTITKSDARGQVSLTLGDGSKYPRQGRIDFAAAQVTPDTGTVTLRAIVDNPEKELLPGTFVRLELALGERAHAIAIPQQAVIKTPTGHIAWVVVDGKAQRRDLVVGPWIGSDWLIEKGLGAGEVVIVDGAPGLSPGATVQVSPWQGAAAAPAR